MVFKIFYDVSYHELAPELPDVKELNFEKADIWVDVDNDKLVFDTDNGRFDVKFNNYDELLDAIIRIGKTLFFNDISNALDQARDRLTCHRVHPQLEMAESEVTKLVSAIEKAKENLLRSNFTLILKLGYLEKQYIDRLADVQPEIKKALDNSIEKYRQLCWETYEDDDPDYCDHVVPIIDAIVYAIPQNKSITIDIQIDQIGEVYQLVKTYNSAYDFLKALEEYKFIVVTY